MSANYAEQTNVCCGLIGEGKRPIPLISVDVRATVIHAVAQVEIIQSYVNTGEHPIEAIYYFPVDPDGAVTNFQAELDGRVIKGTVKEREDAVQEYVDAIIGGTTTFLGEETKTDIFKLRVGFLKPGAHVKVIIEYITEVKNEPGTNNIRFYIPTTIAPRYVSPTETDSQATEIKNMTFSISSPAPLSIKTTVSLHGGIKAIRSPTHEVSVQKTEPTSDDDIYHTAVVELSGKTTDMDRDFVLTIEPEEKHKPRMYSETNGNSTAVMVHLLPSFKLCDLKTELIFVLDRSGSMMGKSIALAKKALLLFLHSMPADCYFNIFGFGSSFTSVFGASVKYDDESLKRAKVHARDLDADLGGTEILAPITNIVNQPGIDGYLRQIFILTDGEVSCTDAIFRIIRANAHKMRVFALGIGDGASHGSITGIARAGCGTAAFVTYNESMDEKVLDQLKNALQPCLTEIHLEWEGLTSIPEKPIPVLNKTKTLLGYNKPIETDNELSSDSLPRVEQSPETIPPVFDGSQLLVFGLFRNDCPKSVLITAQSPDGPLSARVELSPSSDLDGNKSLLLHRLAAIKLIRELEEKEDCEPRNNLKEQIVDLACRNGITSRYTSFIAHDISNDEQKLSKDNWVMETRYVPNQLAHGWHGRLSESDDRADGISNYHFESSSSSNRWFPSRFNIQAQADQIVDIMRSNVERVLERDGTLSRLDDRADGCSGAPQSENVFSSWHMRRLVPAPQSSHKEKRFSFSRLMQFINPTPHKENEFSSSGLMQPTNPTPPAPHKENEISSSRLMQLINVQSYDGSFTLNKELAEILGKSLAEMLAASSKYNLSNQVFATALAVSFFVNNLADEKEKWDLIVAKAKKWLNAAVQPENVDAIIELVSEFLKPH